MKTLSERLKIALELSGISQTQLAASIGVTQPAISKLLAGTSRESRRMIQLARALKISPDWLINGSGQMYDCSPIPDRRLIKFDSRDNHRAPDDNESEVPFLKNISFACGTGDISDEDYNGCKLRFAKSTLRRVGANSDGSGVLCFPARGNSMEPWIPDGSTVAININDKTIIDGKIYAINESGWKRLKILYRTGASTISIRSHNGKEHPPEDKNFAEIEITGRMFWYSVLL